MLLVDSDKLIVIYLQNIVKHLTWLSQTEWVCTCLYCHWATNTFISYDVRACWIPHTPIKSVLFISSSHKNFTHICEYRIVNDLSEMMLYDTTIIITVNYCYYSLCAMIHICTKQMMNKVPHTVCVRVCNLNLYFTH